MTLRGRLSSSSSAPQKVSLFLLFISPPCALPLRGKAGERRKDGNDPNGEASVWRLVQGVSFRGISAYLACSDSRYSGAGEKSRRSGPYCSRAFSPIFMVLR